MEADVKTSKRKIVVAWGVVMVPFIWGIIQTLHSASGIFLHGAGK